MYIILKKTRTIEDEPKTVFDAYQGPSCFDAGVPFGGVFLSETEAVESALKLLKVNPVGWIVWDLKSQTVSYDTEGKA